MRLNKFLAACGVASRRGAEKLMAEGRITLNGKPAKNPAVDVDPDTDKVEFNGRPVSLAQENIYLMLYKTAGTDVTRADKFAQKTVFELLDPKLHRSVQSVGRLDRGTTGLLLLTNDGDLALRLTHPRYGIDKEYYAIGERKPTVSQIRMLTRGVSLDDGIARAESAEAVEIPKDLEVVARDKKAYALRIVMAQGRKRIVRRMCEAIDFPLLGLHRSRIGPITLGKLKYGKSRALYADEVNRLKKSVAD